MKWLLPAKWTLVVLSSPLTRTEPIFVEKQLWPFPVIRLFALTLDHSGVHGHPRTSSLANISQNTLEDLVLLAKISQELFAECNKRQSWFPEDESQWHWLTLGNLELKQLNHLIIDRQIPGSQKRKSFALHWCNWMICLLDKTRYFHGIWWHQLGRDDVVMGVLSTKQLIDNSTI